MILRKRAVCLLLLLAASTTAVGEDLGLNIDLVPSELSSALQPAAKSLAAAKTEQALAIANQFVPGPRQLREKADKALLLGLILQKDSKNEEALGRINEALDLRPAFALALLAKAKINFELKNYEAARSAFDEALFFGLKSDENALAARKGLLETLRRLNREPEAVMLAQKFKSAGLI